MKGLLKKICSLVIGLAILLPTPAFAQTLEYSPISLTQAYSDYVESGTISAEDLQQYARLVQRGVLSEADLQAVLAESAVAEVRIYSDAGRGSSSTDVITGDVGHSFVTIRNVRRLNITVGRITLKPGEMVSIGSFGNLSNSNGNHKGVFYNIESSRKLSDPNNNYLETVGLSVYVTDAELRTITSFIQNREDSYHFAVNNCTHFALGVWDRTSGVRLTTGSPSGLYNEIKKQPYYIRNANELVTYGNSKKYYWNGSRLVSATDKRN